MDDLLQHIGHEHPLLFVQQQHKEGEDEAADLCGCCGKPVEGPSYRCSNLCKFFLHKRCAELELAPQITHPFHPKHPLDFLPKSPFDVMGSRDCDFCCRRFSGFVYGCVSCRFHLDVNCALFQPYLAENFSSSLHHHPLVLIENHKEEVDKSCKACKKSLSGPIYKCLDCVQFYFHKECGKLTLQINHQYDRAHPLCPLINDPKSHPRQCCCYLCKIGWDGLVYCCSICNIRLTLEDVTAPKIITDAASHQHPWTLVSSPISFKCDFCGDDGNRTPYICTICDLIIHKKCISLPRTFRITRHPHPISHAYSLQQNPPEDQLECRICHEEVNVWYGIYRCSVSNCNYIAHVNCATHKDVWDETVSIEEVDSRNMITEVIREETVGEVVMAMEIKHAYHDHNLILTLKGETEDDKICDACFLPISTPFYNCEHQQCRFILHKGCAELPREMGHAIHNRLLKLTKNDYVSSCMACGKFYHGFSYRCGRCYFQIDVQCILVPDTLRHPSHEHSLFLSYNNQGDCSGYCGLDSFEALGGLAYRCTKKCDFVLGFSCLTLPLTARYKYDRHPLNLSYHDNSDPTQLYCDLCEEERDSKPWFYYCKWCDNSLHPFCALGKLPSIKPGSLDIDTCAHEHPLTFVDNIWDCPPCSRCGKLCNRQTLKCKQHGCNFMLDFGCLLSVDLRVFCSLSRVDNIEYLREMATEIAMDMAPTD